MKVILIKDVPKLGSRYEVKDVSSGHATNLLIPQGLALAATPDALKRLETQRKQAEAERKIHEDLLVKNIKDLDGKTITISGKANDKGHLFAGLHREAIAAELQKQTELQIDPSFLAIEHPLKELGEHTVEVKGGGKSAKLKIVIEKAE
ncbi:MAG: 50S ribosomal protein L9 [Patescibacteria group bacterium]|nr:50S ribosomal protein L9 [Patescibacteria group bacterium]MDE1966663.1 50S ribosomal protein L9 [Patescibacteria group bacterium]